MQIMVINIGDIFNCFLYALSFGKTAINILVICDSKLIAVLT